MEYNKTQLIDAICEKRGYNAETDGTKGEFLIALLPRIQEIIDKQREQFETMLDKIPTTAKQELKKEALAYLKENEEFTSSASL